MSMQALNSLVARSIIDPEVITLFDEGHLDQIIEDLEFAVPVRDKLAGITYESWTDFAIKAYRVVSEAEASAHQRIELPSPLEGLKDASSWSGQEQVA